MHGIKPNKSGVKTCEHPECDSTFRPYSGRQKYCGRPCNEDMKKRRKAEKDNAKPNNVLNKWC